MVALFVRKGLMMVRYDCRSSSDLQTSRLEKARNLRVRVRIELWVCMWELDMDDVQLAVM